MNKELLYWPSCRGVRYAKSLSIRYFIDIDILQNSLIDIDIFENVLIDIDIFRTGHIDIDIDIDIFQIALIDIDISKSFLSIFSSISICSNFSYQYFADIDILKKSVDIPSIFQKMPIYRQSISIFHHKNMKKALFFAEKMDFSLKMSLSILIQGASKKTSFSRT